LNNKWRIFLSLDFKLPLKAFAKTGSDLSSNWKKQGFVQFEHFASNWLKMVLARMVKLEK
jgi:hypothetical protein